MEGGQPWDQATEATQAMSNDVVGFKSECKIDVTQRVTQKGDAFPYGVDKMSTTHMDIDESKVYLTRNKDGKVRSAMIHHVDGGTIGSAHQFLRKENCTICQSEPGVAEGTVERKCGNSRCFYGKIDSSFQKTAMLSDDIGEETYRQEIHIQQACIYDPKGMGLSSFDLATNYPEGCYPACYRPKDG